MPFKNGGITVRNIEEFKKCEEELANLNGLIQTLNNKEITVKIERPMLFGGIYVTPLYEKIDSLRVLPNSAQGFWIDYHQSKKQISIRLKDNIVYVINLEVGK